MTSGRRLALISPALAMLVSACAVEPAPGELIADPFEGVNRAVHGFNVAADRVVVRPLTQAYDFAAPALVQHLVSNLVDHVRLPVIFFNNVFQGDLDGALVTFGRFGVNTLAGAGGLLDPATEVGLPLTPTDFGLTLAHYDANEGPYIVLPLFGPSTGRDAVGRLVDIGINPLTYVTFGDGTGEMAARVGMIATPVVVARSENFDLIDQVLYESEDSYVTLRAAYVQSRRRLASGGVVDVENLPDIFAE